jgi:hypothetical protein
VLTRIEVLLATLREQVTEIDADEEAARGTRRTLVRQHLIEDIDAARAAVKHARRRMARFGGRAPLPTLARGKG